MRKVGMIRWVTIGMILFSFSELRAEELSEEVRKYHELLLKKPGNDTLYRRFVDAWLDADVESADRKGLGRWLEKKAETGAPNEIRILAKFHEEAGDEEKALATLDEALKRLEKEGEVMSADLLLDRAKLRVGLLDFEEALGDLKNLESEKAVRLRGVILVRLGRPEEAVTEWQTLLAKSPEDEAMREDLIELQLREGLIDDAMETSLGLIALSKDPYQREVRRLRLAEIQFLTGKEEGLASLEKVLAATGSGTWLEREVLAQVQQVFLRDDDVIGLRQYYQSLRETYPQRVPIRKALARRMAENGEMKEAIAMFREVLKITPGDFGNRKEFIMFLEENSQWPEARDEVKELLAQKKGDFLLWERLSRIEEKLENEAGMMAALIEVKSLREGSPEGVMAVARLYQKADKKEEAESILREGRLKFPESMEVTEALTAVLVAVKKEDEAKALWLAMATGGDREELLRVARSLVGHGMKKEAFSLLESRMSDFREDPLVLAQICQLALEREIAVRAVPHALAMVRLAKSPTDLETAIQMAEGVIGRAEGEGAVIDRLKVMESPDVGNLCLLAQLMVRRGDLEEAKKVLTKAESDPESSLLAKFYQVRFSELVGDLNEAVRRQEAIVDAPEGRKTVHLRRLVELLKKAGDFTLAMKRVEQWKQMAPGDQQAWMERADLFVKLGRPDKTVKELRRMIGKFGADVPKNERLARAYEEAGDPAGAERIYRRLYDEAEASSDQMRWIKKWAELAQQEGREEMLVKEFKKRSESNPRAISPWLALAEIYRVTRSRTERLEVMEELMRRRPDDAVFLLEMAKAAKQRRDWERAKEIYLKAIEVDRGSDSKRAFAAALVARSEVEEALAVLQTLPDLVNQPRVVEKTVTGLISAGEIEQAEKYLAGFGGVFPDDWRLRYLEGMLHRKAGRKEEALTVFQRIEGMTNELPGFASQPASRVMRGRERHFTWSPRISQLVSSWGDMSRPSVRRMQIHTPRRGSGPLRAGRYLPPLPRSVEMARAMAYLQALAMADSSEDLNEVVEAKLAESSGEERSFLMTTFRPKEFVQEIQESLEQNSRDVRLSRLWLSLVLTTRVEGADDEKQKEISLKAIQLVSKVDPEFLFPNLGELTRQGRLTEKEALILALKHYPRLQVQQKAKALRYLILQGWPKRLVPSKKLNEAGVDDLRGSLQNLLFSELKAHNFSLGFERSYDLIIEATLRKDDGAQAVEAINLKVRDVRGMVTSPSWKTLKISMGRYFANAIAFPRDKAIPHLPSDGIYGISLSKLSGTQIKSGKSKKGDFRRPKAVEVKELLGQLKLHDEVIVNHDPKDRLKEIMPHLESLESSVLRAVILLHYGMEDEVDELVSGFVESQDLDELFFSAAWFLKKEDLIKSYRILTKMQKMKLGQFEKDYLDRCVINAGLKLIGKPNVDLDLEPSRTALRRQLSKVKKASKDDRAQMLKSFEMDDDLQRFLKRKKIQEIASRRRAVKKRSSRQKVRSAKKSLKQGRLKEAMKIAVKKLENLGRVNAARSMYTRELKPFLEAGRSGELLAGLERWLGTGRQELRVKIYVEVAHILGETDEAVRVCKKILAADPDNGTAAVSRFIYAPEDERNWDQFSPKTNPQRALQQLVLIRSFAPGSGSRGGREVDRAILILVMRAATHFLVEGGEIPSAGSGSRIPLRGLGRSWFDSFQSLAKEQVKAERNQKGKRPENYEELGQVFLKMMEHTLALPARSDDVFQKVARWKDDIGLDEDAILKYALQSFEIQVRALPEPKDDTVKRPSPGRVILKRVDVVTKGSAYRHILKSYSEKGAELLSSDVMTLFRERAPEYFERHQIALKLERAEPQDADEIYRRWRSSLPEDETLKRKEFVEMADLLLLVKPASSAWLDELEEELVEVCFEDYFSVSNREIAKRWASYRMELDGVVILKRFLERLTLRAYGPRANWAIIDRLILDELPVKLRERSRTLMTIMVFVGQIPGGELPLSEFLISEGLLNKSRDNHTELSRAWRNFGGLADGFEKTVKSTLILNQPGLTPERLILLSRLSFGKIRRRGNQSQKLDDAIKAMKNLEPLLIHWVRARLELDHELIELLEKHHQLVRKACDLDPSFLQRLAMVLRQDGGKLGLEMTRILEEADRVHRADSLQNFERLIAYYRQGDSTSYPDYEDWSVISEAVAHEPHMTAEKTLALLLTFEERAKGDVAFFQAMSFRSDEALSRWIQALGEKLRAVQRPSMLVNSSIFLNHLMRSLTEQKNLFQGGAFLYFNLDDAPLFQASLKRFLAEFGQENKISNAARALLPIFRSLDREQRDTFVLLSFRWIASQASQSRATTPAQLDWLRENIPPELKDVRDLLIGLAARSLNNRRGSGPAAARQFQEGRESLLRYLEGSTLPRPMKLHLLGHVSRSFSRPTYYGGPETIGAVSQLMTPKPDDDPALLLKLAESFYSLAPKLTGEVADKYFRMMELVLLLPQEEDKTLRRNQILPEFLISSIKSGHATRIRNLLSENAPLISGKLDLMWDLHEAGEVEILPLLLGSPETKYALKALPKFDSKSAEKIGSLVSHLPQSHRLLIETCFNLVTNTLDAVEKSPSREERLAAIARRFQKEAPEDPGVRIRILGALVSSPAAFRVLEAEIRKISARASAGSVIRLARPELSEHLKLIESVIGGDLQKGSDESLRHHLSSVLVARGAFSPGQFSFVDRLLSAYLQHIWAKLDEQETPKKRAEVAKGLLAGLRVLSRQAAMSEMTSNKRVIFKIQGVLFICHLLAGDEAEFSGMPSSGELTFVTKDFDRNSAISRVIVDALLRSEFVKKAASAGQAKIMEARFWGQLTTRPELKVMAQTLPDDFPVRHIYLWKIAGVNDRFGVKEEEFIEAHRLAVALKDERVINEILLDHVLNLVNSNHPKKALVLAEKIGPGLSPERQKLFDNLLIKLKESTTE